jgi:hypothetical protein
MTVADRVPAVVDQGQHVRATHTHRPPV